MVTAAHRVLADAAEELADAAASLVDARKDGRVRATPGRRDLRDEARQPGFVAVTDGDVRATTREPERRRTTEPTRGARDERDSPFERERVGAERAVIPDRRIERHRASVRQRRPAG